MAAAVRTDGANHLTFRTSEYLGSPVSMKNRVDCGVISSSGTGVSSLNSPKSSF